MSNSTRQSLLYLLSHYYRICIYICTCLFVCVLVVLLNETYGYFYVNWFKFKDTLIQHVLFLSCVTGGTLKTNNLTSSWWQLDLAHVNQTQLETYNPKATDLQWRANPKRSSRSLLLGPGSGDPVPACNKYPGQDRCTSNTRLALRSSGHNHSKPDVVFGLRVY